MDKNYITFSENEFGRYSRHIVIPQFGLEAQRKLKHAKVLVVGAGGLGSPLLMYLTAAGVGTIGIVDYDRVDESNLQRQILFTTSDAGKLKSETAQKRLKDLNPHLNFILHNVKLDSSNALDILKNYDVIADGTDNFPTRYLINDACVILGKPNVYGSVFRFEGQISVFNFLHSTFHIPHSTLCYRCLYPQPPAPETVQNCEEGGVLGVLPGIIGSMQASEIIKIITGIGEVLAGKLFIFDALNNSAKTLKISRDENCPVCGKNPTIKKLIDYEEFCGIKKTKSKNGVGIKEITVRELKNKMNKNEPMQIIDVREPYERELCNIGGELIPMGTIMQSTDKIREDIPVVVYCRSGNRSMSVIAALEKQFGFQNLYNLKGGILAWADEIDTKMAKY